MNFEVTNTRFDKINADAKVIFVKDKNLDQKWVEDKELLISLGFKGEAEEVQFLAHSKTIYIGCEDFDAEEMRSGAAKAYKLLKKAKCKTLKVATYASECPGVNIKAMVEGFELASYEHTAYKSKNEEVSLEEIIISTEEVNGKDISMTTAKKAAKNGKIIAEATNFTKEIVNTPPHDYTPVTMAEDARELVKIQNVTCKVYDEKFLEEEGMGAFLAVNRASVHPPRLIHLTYKPENAKEKIVYVGKGLTYDSGGLSLKPSDYMVSMKSDKSGGAAVLGILKGAAELELPFEIHAIVGATENMIGGDAYKPDDVLKSKNGKTIEIRNTDAEGRLVLADCLCYAQELKPDLLIDMATLTGACVVALGEYTTGIMGNNHELKEELFEVAGKSGELTTPLYFNKYLKKLLKSNIADMSNISSSRYGGALTAGIFLDNFIEDENKDKWLHLDIAGPAYHEKEWGYNQAGGTGAGVRMNLYWMIEKAKKEENN